MTKADSQNSTGAPVDPTRRRFLSTAGVAAGAGALALAIPPAAGNSDPIFALIEAHKAAESEHRTAVHYCYDLEDRGFKSKSDRESDRHLKAANTRIDKASEAADEIALRLIGEPPVSVAGVAALLSYAAELVAEGGLWPDMEDDLHGQEGWQHHVIARAAETLRGLLPVVSS